jgi:hypothetical protein
MRKLLSRRVSLRLGLGAVALSLGAVVVGPATAASAVTPGDLTLCAYAGDAYLAFPDSGFSLPIVPSASCQHFSVANASNEPVLVYSNGQLIGATVYNSNDGEDIVVYFDGHQVNWWPSSGLEAGVRTEEGLLG